MLNRTVAAGAATLLLTGCGATHHSASQAATDTQVVTTLRIAPEATPAVRTFALTHHENVLSLTPSEVRAAILLANPGVPPQALGLRATPLPTCDDQPDAACVDADPLGIGR